MPITAKAEDKLREHHFFIPEFVEFIKTRNEYPIWKDGMGVFYRKGALFMIDHPAADFKLTHIKDVKAVDLMVDFDNTRLKYMDYAGISCAALSNSALSASRESLLRLLV